MKTSSKEFRGTIRLDKDVFISDPNHDSSVWCTGLLHNMLPGEYNCYVQYKEDTWCGKRISLMEIWHIAHDYHDDRDPRTLTPFTIGVDSGQCGIYDFRYFVENYDDKYWKEDIYDNCTHPNKTFDGRPFENKCFAASSGFGDGEYNCFIETISETDEVYAIQIIFMPEEIIEEVKELTLKYLGENGGLQYPRDYPDAYDKNEERCGVDEDEIFKDYDDDEDENFDYEKIFRDRNF